MFPLPSRRQLLSPPPLTPKKILGIGALLSQMQLIIKEFNIEFGKRKARSSQQVQCNTEFR